MVIHTIYIYPLSIVVSIVAIVQWVIWPVLVPSNDPMGASRRDDPELGEGGCSACDRTVRALSTGQLRGFFAQGNWRRLNNQGLS